MLTSFGFAHCLKNSGGPGYVECSHGFRLSIISASTTLLPVKQMEKETLVDAAFFCKFGVYLKVRFNLGKGMRTELTAGRDFPGGTWGGVL